MPQSNRRKPTKPVDQPTAPLLTDTNPEDPPVKTMGVPAPPTMADWLKSKKRRRK